MTRYKRLLLGATASAALLGGAPAYAFEIVDWTWDKDVNETVTINTYITTTLVPDGLVQVEKLQAHFGNLNATANVSGVHNNPSASTSGGIASVDETFTFDPVNYNSINGNFPCTVNAATGPCILMTQPGADDGDSALTASLLPTGDITEDDNDLHFQIRVTGDVTVPPGDGVTIDAVDLPKVENAATAVANNQSISADVPLYLHDAQFAAGGFNPTCGDGESNGGCPDALGFLIGAYGVTVLDNQLDGINEHTSMAGLLTVAAATGFIEPASITATANVSDILNAYVENSATAVTNNASFSVLSDLPANHAVVADLTQWGYANVNAAASVNQVVLNDYTGFGAAGLGGGYDGITPIVSNSATAVGNNLSIKVGNTGISVPDV
ncbi:MAG: hypothetical protein KKB66_00685 [Alphaproteobacteria bacterium]|nr:hypothetical protein [Alphaproteobacteria bacterium]MBU0804736.1 hypothetical protein [Alphaproteobacteria bacterium]MBU0873196.1 hypothetical protein [Alphaproteobacteria bacterium]MBU1403323.1 hypothetical protein [Alphaproteobacteria bacterium]MBU1589659.1 hypothetical protein [Alphaproteobacteria bacterium]